MKIMLFFLGIGLVHPPMPQSPSDTLSHSKSRKSQRSSFDADAFRKAADKEMPRVNREFEEIRQAHIRKRKTKKTAGQPKSN
jgi:hypothetical protein